MRDGARYYSIPAREVDRWRALGWLVRYTHPTNGRGHGAVVWDGGDRTIASPPLPAIDALQVVA